MQRIRRRPDLARETVTASHDSPVDNNAAAKPCARSHDDARLRAVRRAPAGLAERMGLNVAKHGHGEPENVTQTLRHRLPGPAGHDFIGVGDRSGLRVDSARRADTDA